MVTNIYLGYGSLLPPTAEVLCCVFDWSFGFQPGILRALWEDK